MVQGKIDQEIRQQGSKGKVTGGNKRFSDGSKEWIIESLKRRVENLEDENNKLRKDNSILLGKMCRQFMIIRIRYGEPYHK